MSTVLTYGTFDLLHYGHIELLKRAYEYTQGGKLIVGLSTDEFNAIKGKRSSQSYEKRRELLSAIRYVSEIIPENSWDQKPNDVIANEVDIFIMGDDWSGKFDHLKEHCEVIYLPRTPEISSTLIKGALQKIYHGRTSH